MVSPGSAAVCPGTVMHHRIDPDHRFTYPTTQIWIDPDQPDQLCQNHRLWSHRFPAPVQIRRQDYFDGSKNTMADGLRTMVDHRLGERPDGAIRMLTQPRMWGWLFNPITTYLLWKADQDQPVAAILEVSNTPWRERHHYVVGLEPDSSSAVRSQPFQKQLHVSPFIENRMEYRLRLVQTPNFGLRLSVDVAKPDGTAVLATALTVKRLCPSSENLASALRSNPLATHRVSSGIHAQAARLWRKRVPFVKHPKKSPTGGSD